MHAETMAVCTYGIPCIDCLKRPFNCKTKAFNSSTQHPGIRRQVCCTAWGDHGLSDSSVSTPRPNQERKNQQERQRQGNTAHVVSSHDDAIITEHHDDEHQRSMLLAKVGTSDKQQVPE